MKDADKIIGDAIVAKLSEMFYRQIHNDDIPPAVIAEALLIVAGNISSRHLGIKRTVKLFRSCASVFEEKIPTRLN